MRARIKTNRAQGTVPTGENGNEPLFAVFVDEVGKAYVRTDAAPLDERFDGVQLTVVDRARLPDKFLVTAVVGEVLDGVSAREPQ